MAQKITWEVGETLKPGYIYKIGYNHVNRGVFYWRHVTWQTVEKGFSGKPMYKLTGQLSFRKGDIEREAVKDLLYYYEEYDAYCSGSGCEPSYILSEQETEYDVPVMQSMVNVDSFGF